MLMKTYVCGRILSKFLRYLWSLNLKNVVQNYLFFVLISIGMISILIANLCLYLLDLVHFSFLNFEWMFISFWFEMYYQIDLTALSTEILSLRNFITTSKFVKFSNILQIFSLLEQKSSLKLLMEISRYPLIKCFISCYLNLSNNFERCQWVCKMIFRLAFPITGY